MLHSGVLDFLHDRINDVERVKQVGLQWSCRSELPYYLQSVHVSLYRMVVSWQGLHCRARRTNAYILGPATALYCPLFRSLRSPMFGLDVCLAAERAPRGQRAQAYRTNDTPLNRSKVPELLVHSHMQHVDSVCIEFSGHGHLHSSQVTIGPGSFSTRRWHTE